MNMSLMILRSVSAVLLLAIATGCATYPMGLTKEQWEALPADTQAEYRAEQYRIDEQRRREAEAARAERQRQLEEARLAEQARLTALYSQARYRDIVTVTIPGGTLVRSGRRFRLQPVAFDLVRSEAKRIQLVGNAGNYTQIEDISARMTEDGNTVILNEEGRNDAVITLVNTGWERGVTIPIRSVELRLGAGLTDSSVHVRYKSLPGEPERVIIEQR